MKQVVKRDATNPLCGQIKRVSRAEAIVDAAAALFSEKGYAAVSVDAIAEVAGVSRATVFNSVGGKPALLREAFRACVRSGGRSAGAFRCRSSSVRAAAKFASRPTARGYLAGYAGICTSLHSHMARVYDAIREGARADPEVAALWRDVNESVAARASSGTQSGKRSGMQRAPRRGRAGPCRAFRRVDARRGPGRRRSRRGAGSSKRASQSRAAMARASGALARVRGVVDELARAQRPASRRGRTSPA